MHVLVKNLFTKFSDFRAFGSYNIIDLRYVGIVVIRE